ncbi:MAG: histidinol-phosphate transaminase [Lachnospiraceae bacterium]|nr:histidinol-phosphate transaminase [Lachnospiraceae bacterium]
MKKWEENIRKVTPYVPGEQPKRRDVVKLNTNENPYPPSPRVAKALRQISTESMRKYPDPEARMLVEAIAEMETSPRSGSAAERGCLSEDAACGTAAMENLTPEQIFVGVGSDDVLAMIFLTFFNSEKPVLFPDITYSFYDVWADMLRIPYERQPLNEAFEIVGRDYYKENGGVIFPNPNAPTGALLGLDVIEDIIRHNQDVIVVVDEAYIDFGGVSCVGLLEKYDNLIVVKTFSKSRSMAGMRIGYAVAGKELIGYLNDVKYSFNSYTMNQTAILLGTAAARDNEYFEETRRKIIATREKAKLELAKLGFSFQDSQANFLFVTHKSVPAAELFAALKEEGIYVRYFDRPRIDNYLRITIGTDEEMERLYAFLRTYPGIR